jgi:glutaredoxin
MGMTEIKCTKVAGDNCKHKVRIFTLSTCGWCKKLKSLLQALDVEYEYVDVDQASGEEREMIREKIREINPKISFPTMIVDDDVVIVGFQEDKVREVLEQ